MKQSSMLPEERFAMIVGELLSSPGVTPPGDGIPSKRGFGSSALKIHNKIFAMLVQGRLVVKLPKSRVDALVARGDGERFDPKRNGQFMKEWVCLETNSEGLFLLIDSIAPEDPELDAFDNTVEKRRDASHGRSHTLTEWRTFFAEAGLHIEQEERFRRTHDYDDWTARSQLSAEEKADLERFILSSQPRIQRYFAVTTRADGHLDHFSMDFVLLKGRKVQPGAL